MSKLLDFLCRLGIHPKWWPLDVSSRRCGNCGHTQIYSYKEGKGK